MKSEEIYEDCMRRNKKLRRVWIDYQNAERERGSYQAVHTDREVKLYRSDVKIKKNKEKTCALLDVALPANRNVVQNEAEKNLMYKIQCIEIQLMWNLKCMIVPVIIGATGIVMRSLRENLETVAVNHSIDSLQKTAILGKTHTIRKVLQCET